MSSFTKIEAPLPLQLHSKRNTLNNTHVVFPDSFDQTMSPCSMKKLFCVTIVALLSMAQSHVQLVEGKKVSNVLLVWLDFLVTTERERERERVRERQI